MRFVEDGLSPMERDAYSRTSPLGHFTPQCPEKRLDIPPGNITTHWDIENGRECGLMAVTEPCHSRLTPEG